MCGICGIALTDVHREPGKDVVETMKAEMVHRGPDGHGSFFDKGIGLGHRRLSIIDLEGGRQPIFNEDRTVAVVVNGEIYNYVELRQELRARGHHFNTKSDTEVIVHLYEEVGLDCLKQLNGMFGVALWDTRQKRLVLARDRVGKKPMYYRIADGGLLFASELKALVKALPSRPEIDVGAIDDYLLYGYVPSPSTIWSGIHKLAPAHWLSWEAGQVESECYWNLTQEHNPVSRGFDLLAASEELKELLKDATRIRLRSDVPVGIFLSGGVDSGAVVGAASEVSDQEILTFSVGFEEESHNELPLARLTSDKIGTHHSEMVVKDVGLSDLPEILFHLDEPFADASALPTYYVCREARKRVTVALSGDGGDEVFGGYHHYMSVMRSQWADHLPSWLRRGVFGAVSKSIPRAWPGKGFLSRLSKDLPERFLGHVCIFPPEEKELLWRKEYSKQIPQCPTIIASYFGADHSNLLSSMLAADYHTYLPDDILVKVDRTSMQNSLEVRAPLLDYRIAEFMSRQPLEAYMGQGRGKRLLRCAASDWLPAEVLAVKKRGFGLPLKQWLRDSLRKLADTLLFSSAAVIPEYLRIEAIQELVDLSLRTTRDFGDRIWSLLVLEIWLRLFVAGESVYSVRSTILGALASPVS